MRSSHLRPVTPDPTILLLFSSLDHATPHALQPQLQLTCHRQADPVIPLGEQHQALLCGLHTQPFLTVGLSLAYAQRMLVHLVNTVHWLLLSNTIVC